jgi:hypothetical protein
VTRAPAQADPEPTPAHEARALAVACATWPGFMTLPADVAKLRLIQVDHVLAGRGCLLSQKDREAVEAAALAIPEEAEP